jgi:hypothetical protein
VIVVEAGCVLVDSLLEEDIPVADNQNLEEGDFVGSQSFEEGNLVAGNQSLVVDILDCSLLFIILDKIFNIYLLIIRYKIKRAVNFMG